MKIEKIDRKILVIDDDDLVRRSIANLLTKGGYDVVVAHNAESAIKEIERSKFDLVVSDIKMPGKNGVETVREIKKIISKNSSKDLPIIFITGYAESVEELKAEFFGERNYKLACYKNGTEANAGLTKEPVDISFVDIKLPGMQGDELISSLAKQPNPPYMIPISADPLFDEMESRLKESGCHPYITKPLDIIELIEIVKTIAIKKDLLG